jgi:hypothetical protein
LFCCWFFCFVWFWWKGDARSLVWDIVFSQNSSEKDSKMVARGKKQKACLLKWNLGETLETHLAGKATEKRQNCDPSTPPAYTEHLHFTLNGEIGGAPGHQTPASTWPGKMQTRWAKQYMVLPQTTLGQISIALWTDW